MKCDSAALQTPAVRLAPTRVTTTCEGAGGGLRPAAARSVSKQHRVPPTNFFHEEPQVPADSRRPPPTQAAPPAAGSGPCDGIRLRVSRRPARLRLRNSVSGAERHRASGRHDTRAGKGRQRERGGGGGGNEAPVADPHTGGSVVNTAPRCHVPPPAFTARLGRSSAGCACPQDVAVPTPGTRRSSCVQQGELQRPERSQLRELRAALYLGGSLLLHLHTQGDGQERPRCSQAPGACCWASPAEGYLPPLEEMRSFRPW